jgi:hypothetical protein
MAGFEVTLYGRIWVTPKDLSHNTQASYRDTLALLMPFAT